jgi:hypothetical protein
LCIVNMKGEVMDDLGRKIARHLDEERGLGGVMSEVGNKLAKPRSRCRPWRWQAPVWANPFGPRKWRSSVLSDEAGRLYNAVAFAQWSYGLVLNSHMTVVWGLLGVQDHRQATHILSKFNHEAAKWFQVEGSGRRRKGTGAQTWGGRSLYIWAFIAENTNERGLHVHQIFHAPDGKAKAFAEWATKRLAELAGLAAPVTDAVCFTPTTKRDGFSPHAPRFKSNELERCWAYFRYLIKNIDPDLTKQVNGQSNLQRVIFRADVAHTEPPPVYCARLFGCSENTSIGEQRAAGFVSKFESGNWEELYNGSELNEFQAFRREERQAIEITDVLTGLTI